MSDEPKLTEREALARALQACYDEGRGESWETLNNSVNQDDWRNCADLVVEREKALRERLARAEALLQSVNDVGMAGCDDPNCRANRCVTALAIRAFLDSK